MASYVFPSAEHSRFIHSLGVFATAMETYAVLKKRAEPCVVTTPGLRFDDATEIDFCLAAMCHDIGHTAFSHVLEGRLLPAGMRRHEECTIEILLSTPLKDIIEDIADLDGILLLISREHPNKALSSLISGPFDVDRCDYLLRDSRMAGVDCGQFDFAWLLHSMGIDLNDLDQPILVLDGPRGIDSLRQFLSARRYMHRQIYYHPTIRAGQLLLKGIFERAVEAELGDTIITQAPYGLRNYLRGRSVSVGDFLATTDVNVMYLIKLLANISADDTLSELCQMFVRREYPKCVLDSAKTYGSFEQVHGIIDPYEMDELESFQLALWADRNPVKAVEFEAECRELVQARLSALGRPPGLAKYLVSSDKVKFRSDPPTDFMFSYDGANVPLEGINHEAVGYNVPRLLESFEMFRFFAPEESKEAVREIAKRHGAGER